MKTYKTTTQPYRHILENYPDTCPTCGEACSLEGEPMCYECLHSPAPKTEICSNCGGHADVGEHWIKVAADQWICRGEKRYHRD